MAHQNVHVSSRLFTIDLHGVKTQEAARIIRVRLKECWRYGLQTLKVVFGSPDRFGGSILEALGEIVQASEYVLAGQLPDWIFEAEGYDKTPIFLAVPIKPNFNASEQLETAIFQKFKAEFEQNRAQKLLCEIPYQPLRSMYDWKYSARALGQHCTGQKLRDMCSELRLGIPDAEGLTLEELMRAAEVYGQWDRHRTKGTLSKQIVTEPICVAFVNPAEFLDILPDSATYHTGEDVLRLVDRLFDLGRQDHIEEILDQASHLCTEDNLRLEWLIRKARYGLRTHNESTETWLLKADSFCVQARGGLASRRLEIVGMLTDWYAATGESSRALEYSRVAGQHLGIRSGQSRKKQLANDLTIGQLLQSSGAFQESMEVLMTALWTVVLEKTGKRPMNLILSEKEFADSHLPVSLLGTLLLLVAQVWTDMGDETKALDLLQFAEIFMKRSPQQAKLKSRISLEIGRAHRRRGSPAPDVLKYYDDSDSLNNEDGSPDLQLRYLLNMNRGVVLASSGKPRSAAKAYERAEADGLEVYGADHPDLFDLLFNRSSLYLRVGEFREAADFAIRAAEILELKIPERHADIAKSYLWAGQACNAMGRSKEALGNLGKAKKYFALMENPRTDFIAHLHRELSLAIKN